MARTFTTLFPPLLPEHFSKDVGRIPQLMAKRGYRAMIVGLEKEGVNWPTPPLPMGLLKLAGMRGHLETCILSYLQNKSAEVDVMNLYHLRRDTIFFGRWYKRHNPDGLLYLKMDSYNEELQEGVRYSSNPLKHLFFKWHERRFLQACDLISVENLKGLEILKKSYPVHAHKMIHLPNGVDLDAPPPKRWAKENILLSVGRLDDAVKNYGDLMAALPDLPLDDWKVIIVGRGHEEMEERLFAEAPRLRDKVEFTGPITDRKKLFGLYARATLYVQPSLHESFGIAMAEALCHGCYLIGSSGMSAFDDLSDHGVYGVKLESGDRQALKNTLKSLMEDPIESLPSPEAISTFARSAFSWEIIADRLEKEIAARRSSY